MSSLYEINEELLSCIDLESGEIIEVEKFDMLNIEKEAKIENIALWYKNLLSDAEQFKKEKEAFAEKEKSAKNKADSLKRYLDISLRGNKFNTVKVNITYRKSSSVDVFDIDKLPEEYKKSVTTVSADKIEIGKALKSGVEIDGATIVESNNIQIK